MISQKEEKSKSIPPGSDAQTPEKEREQFSAQVDILGPVFYNPNVSDKAKLLYGLLSAMTRPPNYYAFAKNATLCKYLCCSERTLQKYLGELISLGEIWIENGEGGNQLRRIRVGRLQPSYPAGSRGGTPQDLAGSIYKDKKNIKKSKKENPQVAEEDILRYIDEWAVRWEAEPDLLQKLVKDLRAFVDFRKAKKKPILTFGQADYALNRLSHRSEAEPHRVPAMCFMLESAVLHNWEEPYAIDDRFRHEYEQFLISECGIRIIRTEGDDSDWL